MVRRALWLVTFACGACGTALLICGAMEASGVATPGIHMDAARRFNRALARVPPPGERSRRALLLFGDSTAIAYPDGKTVPDRLRQLIATLPQPDVDLFSLAAMGTGPFDYYLMADRIAAAEPDMVLVLLNLAAFSRRFSSAMARPELAGWLGTSRLGEVATMPLDWIGLTWDRLLFYRAIVGVGADDLWYRIKIQQARIGTAKRTLEEHILETLDRRDEISSRLSRRAAIAGTVLTDSRVPRYNAETERLRHDAVLDGLRPEHPVLRALRGTVRRIIATGCEVIVAVVPMNVEHLRRLGISTDGIDESIRTVGEIVTREGASYVELHDLFPDDAFRDHAGHFTANDEFDGPARLTGALWPGVQAWAIRGPVD